MLIFYKNYSETEIRMPWLQKTSKKSSGRKCPECGSDSIMRIHYGFIDDPDAMERIKNGEFATGGCCIDEDSPKWQCRDCNKEFGKVGNI